MARANGTHTAPSSRRVGSESRIELTFDRPSQINPEPRIGAFGRLVVEDAKFLILVGQDPLFGFGWHM